jgi:hypothetical protein
MSIKTSKRIALGVIAGLVFAPFAAIAPASAAALEITSTAVATAPTVATTTATPASVGVPITATLNFVQDAIAAVGPHTITNTYVLVDPNGTVVTASATFTSVAGAVGGVTTTNVLNVYTHTVVATATAATKAIGTIQFTPAMAGVYTLTHATVNTTLAAGDTNTALPATTAVASFFVSGSGAVVATAGVGSTAGVTATVGGQAQIRFATDAHGNNAVYTLTSSGVGSIQTMANGGATNAASFLGIVSNTDYSQGARVVTPASTDTVAVIATTASTVAGVQTLTWTAIDTATGAPRVVATQVITWGGAPTVSAQFSTSIIAAGAAVGTNTDALNVSLVSTIGGQAANIQVTVRDQNGNPLAAGITASIAGPGLLGLAPGAVTNTLATGRALSLTAAQVTAAGTANVTVHADGTAGVATITISSGTVTLATETVTFFGTVATLEVTQNLSVASASAAGAQLGTSDTTLVAPATTAAGTPAVVIVAKDSNGTVVPGLTITGVSSNTAVISSTTVAQAAGALLTIGAAGPGTYLASVTSAVGGTSGATATVTFRTANPAVAGAFIEAAPLTFTLGGGVETETLSFDKATYLPGEAVVITRTAKDLAGNPVFDGTAAPAVSFNKAMGGTAIGTSFYVGGVRATSATAPSVFAPVTFGEFTARATSGNAAATVITATASVPAPVVPVVAAPVEKPTLTVAKNGGRTYLSGVAVDGEGDIIIYVKKIGTSAWKERAKTLEVSAPGDFNGSIRSLKSNIVIRVKQEGTGLFSNQVIVLK